MKKIFSLTFSLICLSLISKAQNIAINTDGSAADASSILDVKSTTKGMLVPRMTTTQRTAITTPATGLLVFDTDTKSFWFYNGSAWTNFSSAAGGSGWSLTGNSGTDTASNFIGTTDNMPLLFKSNNKSIGRLSQKNILLGENAGISLMPNYIGNIAIGKGALAYSPTVNSTVAIGDSALAYTGLNSTYAYDGDWNTGIGTYALKSNTSGRSNTATGFFSLSSNITGSENTGLGYSALTKNTTGWQNTAVGESALYNNETGSGNTAVGSSVLADNTSGKFNTAIGTYTMQHNINGNNNVAIGFGAFLANQSGYSNVVVGTDALRKSLTLNNLVAIGDSALYNNGTDATLYYHSIQNTAIGSKALFANTTGSLNTASGYNSLTANITGLNNTGHGAFTLRANTTGTENTASGRSALYNNTIGNSNTAVGSVALFNNTDGDYNTALGVSALSVNTTGNGNTALGYNADVSTGTLTNATAIGYNATVNASNKIRLGNSSVTVIEGQVAYTTSDGRFKQNIKDNVPGLDFITALKPLTYQYRSYEMEKFMSQGNAKRQAELKQSDFAEAESMVHMGFIAQDVDKLVKEKGYNLSLVHTPTNATDNYSIAYGELVVPLIKAVQEQQKMIEELKKEVEALKAQKK